MASFSRHRRLVAACGGVLALAGLAAAPMPAEALAPEPVLALYGPPERAPAEPCECSAAVPPRVPLPVRLYSGELFYAVVDLRVKGRGLDFVWSRTYRSRVGPAGALGVGWDFSYNIFVTPDKDALVLHDGGGRADRYLRRSDGTYTAPGFFRVLRRVGDGTYTVDFPDGGTWSLRALDGSPAAGRIDTIRDRNGNQLVFAYDAAGRLDAVTDTLGRTVDVGFDTAGQLTSIVDFTGRRVRYAYYGAGEAGGGAGDLRSVTGPAVTGTSTGNDFPDGRTTTYTYATGHNLASVTDPLGRTYLSVEYQTAAAGLLGYDRVSRLRWGGPGDTVDLVYAPGPAPAALTVIVNDRVGNVSEYSFDSASRLLAQRDYTGRADPDRPTTATDNRPTGRVRTGDPGYVETRWQWNGDSLPVRVVQPDGGVTERVFGADEGGAVLSRGDLRVERVLPGPRGGDQGAIVRRYAYRSGLGGCCDGELATEVTDPRGNVTRRTFDARGNLTRVTGPVPGIVDDYGYDEFGEQVRHVGPDNGDGSRRVDTYTYADADLAQEVVDADGLRLTTRFEYDARGNAVRVIDPRGNDTLFEFNQLDEVVREHTAPVGGVRHRTDHRYDAAGNVTRIETPDGLSTVYVYGMLDEVVRVAQEVAEGQYAITEYGYDANRAVVLRRSGEAASGRQPGAVTLYVRDERGRVYDRVEAPGTPARSTTRYDHDAAGRLVRLSGGVEAGARDRWHEYDGYGRVVRTTDAMGNTTTYGYDAAGNQVAVRVDGELADGPGAGRNVRLSARTTGYDAANRPVREDVAFFDPVTQQPIGDGAATTETVYNGLSNVARVVDDDGLATTIRYDTAGRGRAVVDPLGNSVSTEYDDNGNVTRTSESGGATTRFAYDARNNLVESVDGAGTTRYAYDARGNRTAMTDALGNRVTYQHDGLDRLLTTTRTLTEDGTGAGRSVGSLVTAQAWDDNGRRVAWRDPNGNVTRYRYDELGRQVAVAYADGTAETADYDAHGDRIGARDANGTLVRESYDALGRLDGRSITPGSGVAADTTVERYRYDGLSRLVGAGDDDSTVDRTYDSLSHLTREVADGATVACRYTAVGVRSGCTYPGGRTVTVTHDALRRPIQVADEHGVIAAYGYEGAQRIVRRSRPGAAGQTVETMLRYDAAGRLVASATPGVDARTYAWDAGGNLLAVDGSHAGDAYRYDSAHRLAASATTRYTLDDAGNRRRVDGGSCAGEYTMDPSDRPVNQSTTTPCGARRYDANGNLTAAGGAAIGYDFRNRMVRHTDRAGAVTTYRYDALGRRTARTGGGVETRLRYDGDRVVEEQDATGATTASYVHGAAPGELLSVRRGGVDYFAHHDHLGSVVALTDRGGAVVERYRYGDFGAPTVLAPDGTTRTRSVASNPYRFAGGWFDTESGLYRFGARHLDPVAGRFTTRDPIGMWGDPANLGNGTAYAANNPTGRTDHSGLSSIEVNKLCTYSPPGPKHITMEFEDMNFSQRHWTGIAGCRGWAGSYRAWQAVKQLRLHVESGGALVESGCGSFPFCFTKHFFTMWSVHSWFGRGGDAGNTTTGWTRKVVEDTLYDTYDGFRNDLEIEYEGDEPGCMAYVYEFWSDIHVCKSWFNDNPTTREMAAVLAHEFSHSWGETEDHGYLKNRFSSTPASGYQDIDGDTVNLTEPVLRENADTYSHFIYPYIPS